MNSISKQILRSPLFFPKLLVGALLIYSLLGIPFFLGYLARYLRQYRERHDASLPQWNGWLALLVECWELLIVVAVYAALPMLLVGWLACALSGWLGWVLWIPLWVLPWAPAMLLFFLAPLFTALAYEQYLTHGTMESAFRVRTMLDTALRSAEELIAVTLMFWGVMLIGFPIFGFSLAFALILYFPIVFQIVEQQTHP